jgi:hypothetical protein
VEIHENVKDVYRYFAVRNIGIIREGISIIECSYPANYKRRGMAGGIS